MNRPEEHESPLIKRRYPRYEIETELRASNFGAKQRGVMRGRSLNMSEALQAFSPWDVGTSVNLEFSVPVTTYPVRIEEVVRSHADYRYGFEFVGLMPYQRELIGKTCRTLALLQ